MIYTVTFNPAIDYVVKVGELVPGEINRSSSEEMYFGGKGINVSLVLRELGIESVSLGFVAGFTGEAIANGVASAGVLTDFIRLKNGNTRINVKIKSKDETDINGRGPDIDGESLELLFRRLDALVPGDMLVLSGSIPSSLPDDIYERILGRLDGRGIDFVVDATKDLLKKALKYRPFLIKPNNVELGEMFGLKLTGKNEIASYARKLQELGARNVLVSMAGDGALLIDENGTYHECGVCAGKVRNSVGAGDSMVAGFIAGSRGGDYEKALRLGTACGGATAFSDGLGTKELINKLYQQLIQEVDQCV